jgi:hypothetical protein
MTLETGLFTVVVIAFALALLAVLVLWDRLVVTGLAVVVAGLLGLWDSPPGDGGFGQRQ